MKVLNVVSLLMVSHLLMTSAVISEDIMCQAGEGVTNENIFTSGSASQCSGLSKITTEAECKLAAEYNRKNNIDKNAGYGDRGSWPHDPPGCFYDSDPHYNKYYWNNYTKSTTQCSNDYKCICKAKTSCTKCPITTYSEDFEK